MNCETHWTVYAISYLALAVCMIGAMLISVLLGAHARVMRERQRLAQLIAKHKGGDDSGP